jgi:hypothetical protein
MTPAPLKAALDNRFYYYYARGREAEHRITTFSGAAPFCVQHEAFKLYQAQYGKDTQADCVKAGLFSVPFVKVDTNNMPGFTVRLNGDDDINNTVKQPVPGNPPPPTLPPQQGVAPPSAAQQTAPAPAPAPAPSGANPGTACQRFANLC